MSDKVNKADERREQALNLLVYAPIGAAMYLRDMAPVMLGMLSNRGKTELDKTRTTAQNMFTLAKSLGQARVNQAQQDVQQRSAGVRQVADRSLRIVQDFGRTAGTAAQAAGDRVRQTAPAPARPAPSGNGTGGAVEVPEPVRSAAGATVAAATADLAIPDYDSLSATQVAQRLGGLAPDELAAVRAHEAAHRGRKTIIGKIDSLLDR